LRRCPAMRRPRKPVPPKRLRHGWSCSALQSHGSAVASCSRESQPRSRIFRPLDEFVDRNLG
jgi:hypothetical protein